MKNALALRSGNEHEDGDRIPNSFMEYLGETFGIERNGLDEVYQSQQKPGFFNLSIDEIVVMIACVRKWGTVDIEKLAKRFVESYYRQYREHCAEEMSMDQYRKTFRDHMVENAKRMIVEYAEEIDHRTKVAISSLETQSRFHGKGKNHAMRAEIHSQTAWKTSEIQRKVANIGRTLLIVNQNMDMIFDSVERKTHPETVISKFRKIVSRLMEKTGWGSGK